MVNCTSIKVSNSGFEHTYYSKLQFEMFTAMGIAMNFNMDIWLAYQQRLCKEQLQEKAFETEFNMPPGSCNGMFLLFGTANNIRRQLQSPPIRLLYCCPNLEVRLTLFSDSRTNLIELHLDNFIFRTREAVHEPRFNAPQA